MGFCFATCEPRRALNFINWMYPKRKDFTEQDIQLLYDLIEKDVLRVQDPEFHQPCQIIRGNKYTPDYEPEVDKAIVEFQAALARQPVVEAQEAR